MKPASQYIEEDDSEIHSDGYETTYTFDVVVKIINKSRIELLEELANECIINDDNFNPCISKEQILEFINKIE